MVHGGVVVRLLCAMIECGDVGGLMWCLCVVSLSRVWLLHVFVCVCDWWCVWLVVCVCL